MQMPASILIVSPACNLLAFAGEAPCQELQQLVALLGSLLPALQQGCLELDGKAVMWTSTTSFTLACIINSAQAAGQQQWQQLLLAHAAALLYQQMRRPLEQLLREEQAATGLLLSTYTSHSAPSASLRHTLALPEGCRRQLQSLLELQRLLRHAADLVCSCLPPQGRLQLHLVWQASGQHMQHSLLDTQGARYEPTSPWWDLLQAWPDLPLCSTAAGSAVAQVCSQLEAAREARRLTRHQLGAQQAGNDATQMQAGHSAILQLQCDQASHSQMDFHIAVQQVSLQTSSPCLVASLCRCPAARALLPRGPPLASQGQGQPPPWASCSLQRMDLGGTGVPKGLVRALRRAAHCLRHLTVETAN